MKRTAVFALSFLAATSLVYSILASPPAASADEGPAPGALHIIDKGGNPAGLCPLEHTDVDADIAGFLARVTVTQKFHNPSSDPVEAVYTFPLPDNAAVDRMTMRVGERVVTGKIKPREEARAIYDEARAAGRVASLLDQERPNVFTQSVANIMPGERVEIEISYVETLGYEDGSYKFVFPMVVGPRYIPAGVPDAGRVTPPVTPKGTRAGHDVALRVRLDAGVPLMDVRSTMHAVDLQRTSDRSAVVTLASKREIPNRDFVLTYDVAGAKIEDALLTHRDERGGFFTLILQPPDRVAAEDVSPRELVFVLDTSGSMEGFPIEKAKETMDLAFEALRPQDTFNLITFAGDTYVLFPECVPASPENMRRARAFLATRAGGGGTEMMTAIRTALEPSDRQDHVRIVCFMTDGYVGNDMEIIAEIQKHPNARVFSFGIGSSVNRFLLDRMAVEGRGEVEFVALSDDGSAAARRFAERVHNPLLTDIEIDWGGLAVSDVAPGRVPDVFSARPIVVTGRYADAGKGTIRIRGRAAGRDVVREVAVDLPARAPDHDVIATLWARRQVEAVMSRDWAGMQSGAPREDVRAAVTKLGLDFGLMTQYTSFVAVEEMVVNDGGRSRRVEVPVEMPDGVSYDGVFGAEREERALPMAKMRAGAGSGTVGRLAPSAPPPPARPNESVTVTAGEQVAADAPAPQPAGPAHLAKLDPSLRTATGEVEVRVWLTDTSEATLAKLRKLGFQVVLAPKSAKLVIGRIPAAKLEELAKLAEVRRVAPEPKG